MAEEEPQNYCLIFLMLKKKIFSKVVIRSGCFLSICSARRMNEYLTGAMQMLFAYLMGGHSLETICVSFKHENYGKGIA